jgi:NAD(P)-dependent dehydrogenase (short-subunit alcohol dehydrogenase family)
MKLKNQVAIVTGGSRGIGKTVAEFLVREGANVVILSRDQREITNAVREIKKVVPGAKISGAACDVADAKDVARIIARTGKKLKRIDVLVNCAGIQPPIGPFAENSMADWEANIRVNLLGTVAACKAVLPFMMKQRAGSIINFAGGGATSSRPNFTAYAVAKTGVVRFTEILAEEVAPHRVRVNAVSPGAVNTFMLTEVLAAGARAGKQEFAASEKRAKEGGVAPEVPAALVVFLASSDSRPLTGRLISAPWDEWTKWKKKDIEAIMKTDRFTLRRKA